MSNVLFIGHPTEISQDVVISRLESLGHSVTLVEDAVVTQAEVDNADLAILGWRLRDSAYSRPIAVASTSPVIYTGGQNHGDGTFLTDDDGIGVDVNSINISDANHPLAAGFTGSVVVFTTLSNMGQLRGVYGEGVQPVALSGDSSSRHSLASVPKGGLLANGEASAGYRAYIGFFGYNTNELTDDAWTIFDAAVSDAISTSPPVPGVKIDFTNTANLSDVVVYVKSSIDESAAPIYASMTETINSAGELRVDLSDAATIDQTVTVFVAHGNDLRVWGEVVVSDIGA